MAVARSRGNWLQIDLAALEHNVAALARLVAPAQLWAVVKADAYGHGAGGVAPAALAAGAAGLAVALVEEGIALREAGVDAPVLLLSEPPPDALEEALRAGLTPTLYTPAGVTAATTIAGRLAATSGRRAGVQIKVDTGMHRLGADPAALGALAAAVAGSPDLLLEALWSHAACAEEVDSPVTAAQLERLRAAAAVAAAAGEGGRVRLHLANSAAAIAHPATRLDLVRCGIACYGYPPVPCPTALEPVASWRARVHLVRELDAGEAVSYGLRRPLAERTRVAVVPAGYDDGVPRRYFEAGGAVLIRGRRRPLAGTVTMDHVIVDCGTRGEVVAGDEVVLIGRQGDEQIDAAEWAQRLGTIPHEVLCGIGARVPRLHLEGAQ